MPDIITTLKTTTNQDNVYPNIKTNNIPDSGVTTQKIADNAVTSNKIPDGSITELKLANYCVDENNIINGAVSERCLDSEAVTNSKIAPGAVRGDRISVQGHVLWALYLQSADFDAFLTEIVNIVCARGSHSTALFARFYQEDDNSEHYGSVYVNVNLADSEITIGSTTIDSGNVSSYQSLLTGIKLEWCE